MRLFQHQTTPVTWSVVDMETTGLHPSMDRIVEIGVVRLNDHGAETAAWTTLVNPGRDVGPTRIHGLTARDLAGAPTFRDIANDLLCLLSGTVLVAHNARFDTSFLFAECQRAGLSWGPVTGVCTMATSIAMGLCESRSLADACEELGIPLVHHHTALEDARATGALLQMLLPPRWPLPSSSPQWPTPIRPADLRTRTDPPPARTGQLGALASRVGLPTQDVAADPAAVISYLGLLDHVLEDRVLTENEVDALRVLANEWGISAGVAAQLYDHYVHSLFGDGSSESHPNHNP